jgi:CRP/FNR family cyclic AMP-dependent transcriptional regulator
MMKAPIREELKKSYLFHDFSELELVKVLSFCKHETLDSGDQLFERGVRNEAFYIVHYGSVRLFSSGPQGQMESSMFVGTGGVIGVAAIVSDRPRVMNAEILERTELLKFGFQDLTVFFQEHPEASLKFYQALSKNLANSLHDMILEVVRIREAHHTEKHGIIAL